MRDAAAALVVQTSFLGDMVLTTGLLRELAARGPVDVVATPAGAPLLANSPRVRRVVVYDKRGGARGPRGLWNLARELRAAAYSTAFLAQGSMRSAALAILAQIPERVGFDTSAGRPLYSRTVPYRDHWHHAARLWSLAGPVDATDNLQPEPDLIRPELFPGTEDVDQAELLLRRAGVADGEPLVALAPGSVWATKRWPAFASLAARLRGASRIVVIGGSADRELAAAIGAVVPGTVDATGQLSLLASAALLRRCRALVTNDSAPQHLASAMGTPTVAIFGPTVPEFGFGPLAPSSENVGHDGLDCRPCDRHGPARCPLGHWRCMLELDASPIATLVSHRLSSVPGKS